MEITFDFNKYKVYDVEKYNGIDCYVISINYKLFLVPKIYTLLNIGDEVKLCNGKIDRIKSFGGQTVISFGLKNNIDYRVVINTNNWNGLEMEHFDLNFLKNLQRKQEIIDILR